jgi:hypothetical protein
MMSCDYDPNKPLGFTGPFKFPDPLMKELEKYKSQNLRVSVDSETESSRDYFLKNGYAIIENLCDSKELYCPVPKERGQINYYGSLDRFKYELNEIQVPGSFARYSHPRYGEIHSRIRLILQDILQEELYNTYYYDRFYFNGQRLVRHTDRDACEISVTVQVSSNFLFSWALGLKNLSGEEIAVNLKDGWGMVYMGCDVEHWRDPLPSRYNRFGRFMNKLIRKKDDSYWHQIFFHYVRANGRRAHFAFDSCNT